MLKYICLISVVSDSRHYLARFSKEVSSGASSRSVPFLNTKNLALNAYLLYGRHTCVEPIYIVTNYEHQFESSAADVGYWISVLSPCTVNLKLAGHLATEHESSFEKNINASGYQYLSPPTKTSPSLSFQSLIRLIRKARRRDRFRTCSDRGCKAKAFAKSWAESMCRTWNRPVAPCPGPPLLACFADRWVNAWTVISAPPSRSQRGIGMGAPHPARAERYDTPPHTQQRLSRSGWPEKGRGTQEWANGNRVPDRDRPERGARQQRTCNFCIAASHNCRCQRTCLVQLY